MASVSVDAPAKAELFPSDLGLESRTSFVDRFGPRCGWTDRSVDVERGEEFCNVRPEQATATVLGRGRSPLTIDEGIALVTQQPQLLEKNTCFMLAGSRRHDRRVPALWISERAPKLGWCWDGNPHTWLGLASAGGRVGPG
ncbi:MAG: DUF5701 family protein [Marmoricola sp.]